MTTEEQLKQELSIAYDANAALEQVFFEKNRYIAALEARIDSLTTELAEYKELCGVHDHKAV